jgi:hypothetical protein
MSFELGGCWFARWERALARRGIQSIINKGGLDARACDLSDLSTGALGDYLAKIGAEVTRADRKDGRDGSFSMMGLLREAMETYEAQAMVAWWELESTLEERKTRFVSWSKGAKELRVRAGLAAEQASEEEIAAADLGGEDMIAIDPADWPRLRLVVEVLYRLVETDGLAPVQRGSPLTGSGGRGPRPRRVWNARSGHHGGHRDRLGHRDALHHEQGDRGERDGPAVSPTSREAPTLSASTTRCRVGRGRRTGLAGHRGRLLGVPVHPGAGTPQAPAV